MANIIQLRRATAARWTTVNPILADGEEGLETDTLKRKVGNGVTPWIELPYPPGGDGSSIQGTPVWTYTTGTGTTFPISSPYVSAVSIDGRLQEEMVDFSISAGTLVLYEPLAAGQRLGIQYLKAVSTTGVQVDDSGKIPDSFLKSWSFSNNITSYTRVADTVYGVLDSISGESVTMKQVTTKASGVSYTDSDVDNILIFKIGAEYFKKVETLSDVRRLLSNPTFSNEGFDI